MCHYLPAYLAPLTNNLNSHVFICLAVITCDITKKNINHIRKKKKQDEKKVYIHINEN